MPLDWAIAAHAVSITVSIMSIGRLIFTSSPSVRLALRPGKRHMERRINVTPFVTLVVPA
jgi:hypothetical protein